MRSILLAGCLVCLAVLAAPAVAETATADATVALEPATATVAESAPEAAAPAAGAELCVTEPQETSDGAFPSCGDPCTPPPFWERPECVGYDRNGFLRIDQCTCEDGRWYCPWQG